MDNEKPFTLAECFTWLDANLTPKQIKDLRELNRDELWQTHFNLDKLVKEKLLSGNARLQGRMDESAFCDDPDLASQIVAAYWDHLQMQN